MEENTKSKSELKKEEINKHNEHIASLPKSRTLNDLSREEIAELKSLSVEVFGSSSRWRKLLEQGYVQVVTEDVTELVPGATDEEESTTRVVKVPLKRRDGAFQSVTVRHTVDSVKEYMLRSKAQLDTIRAQIKKNQEEAVEKKRMEEQALKVNEKLHGSAL